jgi:hypothetical protein
MNYLRLLVGSDHRKNDREMRGHGETVVNKIENQGIRIPGYHQMLTFFSQLPSLAFF